MRLSSVRELLTLPAVLLLLFFVTAEAEAQGAYKIDEVINPRCDLSEVPQITDLPSPIFVELNKHKDARVAIIVYGMPGEAPHYARRVNNWLTTVRGVAPERLVHLYGGTGGERRLELWRVPRGAALPPVPKPDSYQGVTKFNTYTYWNPECYSTDWQGALIGFGYALKRRPGWRGRIVVHPGRNPDYVRAETDLPVGGRLTRGGAARRARQDRLYLLKKSGLPSSRVEAVVGEASEWAYSELWMIPPAERERKK